MSCDIIGDTSYKEFKQFSSNDDLGDYIFSEEYSIIEHNDNLDIGNNVYAILNYKDSLDSSMIGGDYGSGRCR